MPLGFIAILILLAVSGAPIAFALLSAPILGLTITGDASLVRVLTARLYNGIDSYPLMAVPFFLLAGEAMNASGVTTRLVKVAQSFVGHLSGGLAQVNIAASILFAGMSGSAVADTSALGRILMPAMRDAGYSKSFAAAVTAGSSVIGPVIPPSGIMIIYAFVMNVSVAGLFAAGLLPGLLMGLGMMVVASFISKRRGYPASERTTWPERAAAVQHAIPALATPVILVGGIFSGLFTPTEAAAIAAVYAIVLTKFGSKCISRDEIVAVFTKTSLQSGIILFLIGASIAFSWMLTVSGVDSVIAEALQPFKDNRLLILLLLNIVLLLVGMFLDAGPAILILGPALGPTFIEIGIDPLHFAVIMCLNLTVGLATPPIGLALFVASSIAGESPESVAREIVPFLLVHVCVIVFLSLTPSVALFVPRLLGFA
ncbi:MAG: TRAP transporter large permease [Pseudomonadota bacterium]